MCIWSPNWECGTSIHPLSGSQKIAVKIGFQAANRNDLERKLNGRKERNARNKLRRTIVLCGIDGSEEWCSFRISGEKKNEDKIFERINYLIKQQVELANIGSSNMEKEIQWWLDRVEQRQIWIQRMSFWRLFYSNSCVWSIDLTSRGKKSKTWMTYWRNLRGCMSTLLRSLNIHIVIAIIVWPGSWSVKTISKV